MEDFLNKIVEYKKEYISARKEYYVSIKKQLSMSEYTRYSLFKKMISSSVGINLIAEIKKASPSRGLIRENFDPLEIAQVYFDNKVAAISILTEDKYFLGKMSYVKKVTEHYDVAVLNKDFIIDEGQIYDARLNGASAVLLIAAILDYDTLKNFIEVASSIDLDCLVEIHTEAELDRALDCGAEIIGINNRDLKTFEVDINNCTKLIPKIPKDIIIVAESGIKTHDDVLMLKSLGANAVLIGETFMKERDIGSKIKEVMLGK